MKEYRKLKYGEIIKNGDMFYNIEKEQLDKVESYWNGDNITSGLDGIFYRPIKKVQRRIDLDGFMIDLGLNKHQRHFMKALIANNYRRRKKV